MVAGPGRETTRSLRLGDEGGRSRAALVAGKPYSPPVPPNLWVSCR